MAAAHLWQLSLNTSGASIVAACLLWLAVDPRGLFLMVSAYHS
jgi:hypothetical protein